MDQIKKGKADGLSEDDQKIWEGEVQDMTNRLTKIIDEMLESKQAEIMQV
jgi:ribosome recycling factor